MQGETRTAGLPTVFVRLTGCPLRCQYCDSAYAFQGGQLMTVEDVLAAVAQFKPRYVTVTGGEPLAQPLCVDLLRELCDRQYEVSLETSGAIDVSLVDPRVIKVVDIKTPGSLEVTRNRYDNLRLLRSQDQVKFVICDEADYIWARDFVREHQLDQRCDVLFSPSHQQLDNKLLADWIVKDNLPVRFQLQLHKYIWGDIPGV